MWVHIYVHILIRRKWNHSWIISPSIVQWLAISISMTSSFCLKFHLPFLFLYDTLDIRWKPGKTTQCFSFYTNKYSVLARELTSLTIKTFRQFLKLRIKLRRSTSLFFHTPAPWSCLRVAIILLFVCMKQNNIPIRLSHYSVHRDLSRFV